MANNDILKIQEIYKLSLKSVLNHLSYMNAAGLKLKTTN